MVRGFPGISPQALLNRDNGAQRHHALESRIEGTEVSTVRSHVGAMASWRRGEKPWVFDPTPLVDVGNEATYDLETIEWGC